MLSNDWKPYLNSLFGKRYNSVKILVPVDWKIYVISIYRIAGNFRGFKFSRIFQKPVLKNISRFLISRTVLVPGRESLYGDYCGGDGAKGASYF